MAAPTYVGRGATSSGTTTRSPGWPTGSLTGDLGICIVETSGGDTALPNMSGWTQHPSSPITDIADATGSKLHVWYKFAESDTPASAATGDAGDHQIASIFGYRGVDSTNPFNAVATGSKTTASTSATCPGVTTTVDDCLIVHILSRPDDATSNFIPGNPSNSNLSSLDTSTALSTQQVGGTAGNGGGYGVIHGVMATAGATGDTTVTLSRSLTHAYFTLALAPAAGPTTYQQACSASATASASLTTASIFARALSASATASAALALILTYSRLLTASSTASAALTRAITKTLGVTATASSSLTRQITKSFQATATAAASVTATLVSTIVQQCYASATASANLVKRVTKSMAATSSAAASLSVGLLLQVQATATATATANLFRTFRLATFGVVSAATATVTRRIGKIFSASASASANSTESIVLTQASSANATASASSTQTYQAGLPPVVRLLYRSLYKFLKRR